MARSSECTDYYAQKVLDDAGIVREACLRQLPHNPRHDVHRKAAQASSGFRFAATHGFNRRGPLSRLHDENGFSVILQLATITDRHHRHDCEPAAEIG